MDFGDDVNNSRSSAPADASGGDRIPPFTARALVPLSAVLLVAAVPIALWYLIGDLSTSPLPSRESDHLVEPMQIPAWSEHAAGIASLVLTVACVALLFWGGSRRFATPRTWIALALLIPAGLIIGLAGRVLTASVIGANIGAGIMLLFPLPLAGILILSALIFLTVSLTRERRRG